MRHAVGVLLVFLTSASWALAQSPKPIFQGLGMTVTKQKDAMTDEQICSLAVDQPPWWIAISG